MSAPPAEIVIPAVLRDQLGYLLHRAAQLAFERGREELPGGRHPKDYALLAALRVTGPIAQTGLAARLDINRTLLGKHVDGLEGEGLVDRRRDERDRRAMVVSLTDTGRRTLEEGTPALVATDDRYAAPLAPAERERLQELLSALVGPERLEAVGELAWRTAYLVVRGHKYLRALGTEAFTPLGIELRHLGVLHLLEAGATSSQQELARGVGVTGPMIVTIVDELEAPGYVERGHDPRDRRTRSVTLTPAGVEVLGRARVAQQAVDDVVAAAIGADGMVELCALLRTLLGARDDAPA